MYSKMNEVKSAGDSLSINLRKNKGCLSSTNFTWFIVEYERLSKAY